tara:strand:- start:2775 stop:2984 length:210 start_codon:yes stop_codon:yes gene_type:complete
MICQEKSLFFFVSLAKTKLQPYFSSTGFFVIPLLLIFGDKVQTTSPIVKSATVCKVLFAFFATDTSDFL